MVFNRNLWLHGKQFPAVPTAYSLIGTYKSSRRFVAPEDGWYQIELFGRSGSGGNGNYSGNVIASGGGGGSGAYCCSNLIKLNKGDIIELVLGTTSGSTSSVTINSSAGESYSVMRAVSGKNGGSATTSSAGSAGAAGTASGGNSVNTNGNKGTNGSINTNASIGNSVYGGAGGAAVVSGGNAGGAGEGIRYAGTDNYVADYTSGSAASGAAFVKIYRGNTNAA